MVIGYPDTEDPDTATQFEALATAMHPEFVFGVTNNAAIAGKENVDAPAMVVYNNTTDERCIIPITSGVEGMGSNIRKAALPLIVDLHPEIHEDLLDVS